VLKFFGLNIKNAYDCIDNIIYHNYLPKPIILNNKLFIEINELTTVADIKVSWKEIKKAQDDYENSNSFLNQKREFTHFSIGKEVTENIDGKLKFIDFNEKRRKKGYKKTNLKDYTPDISRKYKIRKSFKEKYLER
jgi:hypothetical protein